MQENSSANSCVIVGAGISGLLAARELRDAGWDVVVLDKGRGVGGRMATGRFGGASFDHGTQFFTVRGDRFRGLVEGWLSAGVAEDYAIILSLTGKGRVPAASCNGGCVVTRDLVPLEPDANERKFYARGVGFIKEIDVATGARVELVKIERP